MTRSKDNPPNDISLTLSQKNVLRPPLAVIINHSKKLLQDADSLFPEDDAADITSIHTLGEKLSQLVDNFSELDSGTIHNLRTPLNGINGYCEMLLEDSDVQVDDLQKILSAAGEFQSSLETMASGLKTGGPLSPRDAMINEASRNAPEEQPALSKYINRGSILVVDDNAINRDLLFSQLGKQGHEVTLATNGREALDILSKNTIDLMLLDIMMPEMDGLEVLEHLRTMPDTKDLQVIVISALDNIASVVQCIQMGAEDYLLKPFNSVLLKSRINTCLEKKRLKELSKALELRNLREEEPFVAESKVMQNILSTVRTVSHNPVNIILHGSSGTGKEVIARMIHNKSDRKNKSFIAVNCAAVPENLMESEFFGYEKGAFTGADASRGGYFEEAAGGTLFLDEIADMPMFLQPKLLRAIQEEEGRRLGGSKTISYDVRIISATNKNLRKEVEEGRFRKDLFYRIFSIEIKIPPLCERREDIVPLALFFLHQVSKRFGKKVAGFSAEILHFFEQYDWPGNVRQLLREVERLVAFTGEGEEILLKYCSQELLGWKNSSSFSCHDDLSGSTLPERVKKLEIACINEALHQTGGKKLPASKLLGITRVGLDNKIKRYGIDPAAHSNNS